MQAKSKDQKHEFALYTEQLESVINGSILTLDGPIAHRIHSVLRLKPEDRLILFNSKIKATVSIQKYEQRKVKLTVVQVQHIKAPQIKLCVFLPILKPDAFESALYSCVELGAYSVQPIITEKIYKVYMRETDVERWHKIMQAAAEQSKNFFIPVLEPVIKFDQMINYISQINKRSTCSIFFDCAGEPLSQILPTLNQFLNIIILLGPEGDLTTEEKQELKKLQVLFCALTPTVLRAPQALVVGLGAAQSWLNRLKSRSCI
jgi:16S rRNA (uracil1498-N3)-methyltransferase